jgi:hypothetical protein
MATLSFYIRHVLKDEKKIEELLDALNDPNAGVSISEEDVKKTMEDLEKGKLFLRQWKKRNKA